MRNFLSNHKTHIIVPLIVLAVIGLGTYQIVHFLNTGVSQPQQLALVNSQDKSTKSSTTNSTVQPKSSTSTVPSSPSGASKSSGSSSLTPAQADQDETNTNAQIAQENAQYAASIQAEEQTAQQKNQACQSETSAQLSAVAPIQQQIVEVETEETDLPQTVDQQASYAGGLTTQSAWDELYDQDLAKLQSQVQALQTQLNQTKSQYPTPDCN